MLSKEEILNAQDLPREEVKVPEWGGSVFVLTLTGAQRDAFEQSIMEKKGSKTREANLRNIRAKLASMAICDEAGKRMFSDAEAEALGAKSAKALDRIFEAAQRLNGLSNEDVEDLAKNSEGAPSGASTSD